MSFYLPPKDAEFVLTKLGDAIKWISGDLGLPSNAKSDYTLYAIDQLQDALDVLKSRRGLMK